jgi:hypothetical protein
MLMRLPTLFAVVMIWTPILACAQTTQKLVGAQAFCIPKENLITANGWLADATSHLPSDGFAFVVGGSILAPKLRYQPALNIKGEAMPISGTLGPDRDDEWLMQLPPDHYWRRLAEGPEAIVELDPILHQIRAYQTPARDRWIIWAIESRLELRPTSIAAGGSIVALCHRTDFRSIASRRVDETTTCNRRLRKDGFFLSYSFGEANLAKLQAMDSEVWRVVRSWQCKVRSAT